MILKSYQKGEPFIGDRFTFDRSIFLNQMKQAFLSSATNYSVSGHNSNFNLKHVVKSAIGEWIERSSLFCDKYQNRHTIPAFSLLDGEVIEVEKASIIFDEGKKFNDSCGVASHLDSNRAIRSSYYEYFERQSLIFNWLTQGSGTLIDYTNINHDYIGFLIETVKKFVDELYIIDISLHQTIKVVFVLGFGEYYKSVGLSANFDGEQAIIGALEESLQTFANSWTKEYVTDYYEGNDKRHFDMYLSHYYSMKPEEMKEQYYYLINSQEKINIIEILNQESRDFSTESLKQISFDLGIIPYCAYIPTMHNGFNTKIVKVFSPNGYPHMYPPVFTNNETNMNFNKKEVVISNAYKIIPFP
jgi:hypothetical protein